MLSIGEIRRLSAQRERSKSTPTPPVFHNPAAPTLDSAELLLESTVPRPPQLSDFLFDGIPRETSPTPDSSISPPSENVLPKSASSDSERRRLSLSSASFLQDLLEDTGEASEVAAGHVDSEDSSITETDVLLSYPVYSRYLRMLPMKDLLALGKTSSRFRSLVQYEKTRSRRHRFACIYRREFIRYLNLSLGSQKWITQHQVFGNILNELYIQPEHLLVFYSPDIFHYDVRIIDRTGLLRLRKPDEILDSFMRQRNEDDLRVWHFRLFSVIRPVAEPTQSDLDHASLTRTELHRLHLWHSEDLAMIVLPETKENVQIIHQRVGFSHTALMEIPSHIRERNGGDLVTLLQLIQHAFAPKLLILTIHCIPRGFGPLSLEFPVILFEGMIFDGAPAEEWMCFAGSAVTVYQVILDVSDKRDVRDMKLNALYAQLGVVFPNAGQCWLFYFTEMWPGGTSKEIPQCDVLTLRRLFPGVPVLGGRAKRFMGNQWCPILAESAAADTAKSLFLRQTPTIVTVVYID
ncbi:hypothetical protein BV898_07338 [Hypsibius exemplaris]|uniref:F-box domain-containing protein n=1 Tax=Hypsibius exemplaris TaxID=2072580 RepID=A0A1W0WTJ1_HYPEX|nr:hypothetical protein BV898_07338 [Hypsibius exemplaris]